MSSVKWLSWTIYPPTGLRLLAVLSAVLIGIAAYMIAVRVRLLVVARPERAVDEYLGVHRGETKRRDVRMVVTPETFILERTGIKGLLEAFGVRVRPKHLGHVKVVAGIVPAAILLLANYPLVIAVGVGLLAYVLAGEFLKKVWTDFRIGVEKSLPALISRMVAILETTQHVEQALGEVAETFPENDPLRQWLESVIAGLRVEGVEFLLTAQQEAAHISRYLSLVMVLLYNIAKTGGEEYVRAFRSVAKMMTSDLEVRTQASARAAGALFSIHLVLAILVGMTLFLLSQPDLRVGLHHWLVQVISVIAFAIVAAGYYIIRLFILQTLLPEA